MSEHTPPSEEALDRAQAKLGQLRDNIQKVIFGREDLIEQTVSCLLSNGHLLLEGLPGLGKTELIRVLSLSLAMDWKRVQFTPDLLPGDITGNPMLEEIEGKRQFRFHPGPIFTNLLLADEINRASPKTQSAMLEAMQERSVTVMGETHTLPRPFFVMATQNPIELEGTYPLPEAQLDRFLFKLEVTDTPAELLERIVLSRKLGEAVEVAPVLEMDELVQLQTLSGTVYLSPIVANYIARLVHATHPEGSELAADVQYGASPRAAIGLAAASRATALQAGRAQVAFEDVRKVALPILRHRLLMQYEAKLDGRNSADVIADLLEQVPTELNQLPKSLSAAKID